MSLSHKMRRLIAASLLSSVCALPATAADSLGTWLGEKEFIAYRVYSGADGTSKVETISLPVKARPGGKLAFVDRDVENINIGYYADGWFSDWHPANSKRLNIVLQGDFIFDVGDGKEYRVKTGELILAEDDLGKGHTSRCVAANGQRCISMSIAIERHDGKSAMPLSK